MTERLEERPLGRRDEALLVQLADGTLTGPARRKAEARLRAIPDADRLIARQRRVARALGAGADLPPLHAAAAPRRAAPRVAVAGALAAVLALLLVLAWQDAGPTVERAADISQLPATDRAPRASGPMLRAAVDGVRFPDWGPEFGWHATGMRSDDIGGRRATTVFYEHMGHRLAYTIVSGPALPRPTQARTVERNGLRMSVYRDPEHGGHDVAVFERRGRTCVVAGHVIRLSTLLELAAWKGGGSVRS
jgi:hypothetical protein